MEERFEADGVGGYLHRPDEATGEGLVLTHGAGGNCRAPLLVQLAQTFAQAGLFVLRYDLPFRQQRPHGPPYPAGAVHDREGVMRAAAALRSLTGRPVYAGGQSYGGRQTAMAAAEHPEIAAALLLLSYPLHPPGKPEQLRTAFFGELRIPALFVQGTADPFGGIAELTAALPAIPARTELLPIEGARHDLKQAAGRAAELLARLRAVAQNA